MAIWRITIGGSDVPVAAGSLRIEDNIDERCIATFQVIDIVGTAEYNKGQPVEIYDSRYTKIWSGFIDIPKRRSLEGDNPFQFIWQIIAVDNWYLADKRLLAKSYAATLAGTIVKDIVDTLLTAEGITYTGSSIDDGPTVAEAVFNWVPSSRALQILGDRANFWVFIDKDRVMNFRARDGVAAPSTLSRSDIRRGTMQIMESATKYRNTQYVRGARTVTENALTEISHGDGESNAFPMGYRVHTLTSVEKDTGGGFASQTIGVKGIDTGKDWYWSFHSENIVQDDGGTILTASNRIRVIYKGVIDIIVKTTKDDEIDARKTVEGVGSGIVDWVNDEPDLRDKDAAFEWGISRLDKFGQISAILTFQTRTTGFAPGQLLTVNLPDDGLDGVSMLIESIRTTDEQDVIFYTIKAVQGPEMGSWEKFFGDIVERGEIKIIRENLSEDETLITLKQFSKTWSKTEEPNIYLLRSPSSTLVPSSGIVPGFLDNDRFKYAEVLEVSTNNVLLRKILTTRSGLTGRDYANQIATMLFVNPSEGVGSVGNLVWYGGWQATAVDGTGIEVARETEVSTKTALESWQLERTDIKGFDPVMDENIAVSEGAVTVVATP